MGSIEVLSAAGLDRAIGIRICGRRHLSFETLVRLGFGRPRAVLLIDEPRVCGHSAGTEGCPCIDDVVFHAQQETSWFEGGQANHGGLIYVC
jgi:hypothetical protein